MVACRLSILLSDNMLGTSVRSCKSRELDWTRAIHRALTDRQLNVSPSTLKVSRACFASAADAATKGGPDAKKEAKKSALQTLLSAVKVILLFVLALCSCAWYEHACLCVFHLKYGATKIVSPLQTVLTSRIAVLGAGAACLLVANVQTGSVIENYYKDQVHPCLLCVTCSCRSSRVCCIS